jgi:uncharacterized protein (DUF3084 family)
LRILARATLAGTARSDELGQKLSGLKAQLHETIGTINGAHEAYLRTYALFETKVTAFDQAQAQAKQQAVDLVTQRDKLEADQKELAELRAATANVKQRYEDRLGEHEAQVRELKDKKAAATQGIQHLEAKLSDARQEIARWKRRCLVAEGRPTFDEARPASVASAAAAGSGLPPATMPASAAAAVADVDGDADDDSSEVSSDSADDDAHA